MNPDDISNQQELLAQHRRTLAIYLRQLANLGVNYALPGVHNGIADARAEIQRIKAWLHAQGETVDDVPGDEPTPEEAAQAAQRSREVRQSIEGGDHNIQAVDSTVTVIYQVTRSVPPRFRSAIQHKVEDYTAVFGDRATQCAALDVFIEDDKPYALLIAPTGRGKTALLCSQCAILCSERRIALLEASMRNSASGFLIRLLLAAGLVIVVLTLVPRVWLGLISYLLKANQSAGLPQFSATPVSGFAFPTPRAPGRVGEEVTVGKVAIRVTQVVRPANARVGGASTYQALGDGEEYLLVDISVRCLSAKESCRLTEFDFGVRNASGREIPAEFASRFAGLQLFEGGAITAGQRMSGALIFIIRQDDRGLVLYYPRGFSLGGAAEIVLSP